MRACAEAFNQLREMKEGNLWLVDHGDSFAEARPKRLVDQLLAQNTLDEQAREAVAIPLLE